MAGRPKGRAAAPITHPLRTAAGPGGAVGQGVSRRGGADAKARLPPPDARAPPQHQGHPGSRGLQSLIDPDFSAEVEMGVCAEGPGREGGAERAPD